MPSGCGQILGQNVVVENKPGASGIIAIEETGEGQARRLHHHDREHLDQRADAGPARQEASSRLRARRPGSSRSSPTCRCSSWRPRRNFPPKTFAEFIAYAKANPGKVRYGSAGIGSYQQINTEILAKRAGLDLVHIPFKGGGAEIIRDLANGDVQVSWFNITNPVGMMKAGRVRALAIAAEHRLVAVSRRADPQRGRLFRASAPRNGWQRLRRPRSRRHRRSRCNRAFAEAMWTPEMRAAFERGGMIVPPRYSSLEDATNWLRDEMASWKRDVRTSASSWRRSVENRNPAGRRHRARSRSGMRQGDEGSRGARAPRRSNGIRCRSARRARAARQHAAGGDRAGACASSTAGSWDRSATPPIRAATRPG